MGWSCDLRCTASVAIAFIWELFWSLSLTNLVVVARAKSVATALNLMAAGLACGLNPQDNTAHSSL